MTVAVRIRCGEVERHETGRGPDTEGSAHYSGGGLCLSDPPLTVIKQQPQGPAKRFPLERTVNSRLTASIDSAVVAAKVGSTGSPFGWPYCHRPSKRIGQITNYSNREGNIDVYEVFHILCRVQLFAPGSDSLAAVSSSCTRHATPNQRQSNTVMARAGRLVIFGSTGLMYK